MMSVMNNNQPEIQGDTTNLSNPDQPFDGNARDSRISTEEEYRDSSPAARKTETTSRVWEDRSSISLEEMDVAAEKVRIFGEPSGSSQINLWVETRVSEALGKHNMSIGDAMVEKPRDEHLVDDDVLEVSAERDSSTHSYDSYCLDSSELSSTPMGNWSHGLEKGDMVWGKVKSHPWWPGVIFNDALASPAVRRMRKKGLVLVAFFGDNSYGWFDPEELVPFNPYFAEKSRQTTSRNFVKAVEEAVERSSRTRALVAYKLDLPPCSRIHDIFHVSLLKCIHGSDQFHESFPSDLLSFEDEPIQEVGNDVTTTKLTSKRTWRSLGKFADFI